MPFDFLCCVKPGVEDIVELDYSNQSLPDVPNEVFAYERTLETLLCQSNRITELPRQLFMCHGLKYLNLSDNEIQAIPNAISSLVNLQHLNLNRNSLSTLPDTMKALKYLAFLDLSVNPLEKLPDSITNLMALQDLYLNDTYLEYLPGNFGRLANLRVLELRDNYLMILPKSMSRSTELLRLDIGQNEIQQLPEVVGRFMKLRELLIDCNSLTSIPDIIKPLESLIHLEASNNMIEELAPEIGYCTKLVDISLTSNCLTQLPDTIGQLSNLTTMKLDNNRLYSLPDSIGLLANLEELMLMNNYLDSLPSSIGRLRKLQYFNLDENMLRTIPPEIGSCTKLSVLSLRSNKLTKIPAEIGHISSLRVLNLVRNSLSCLPQALLNCENLVALWLSENQSKPLVPMHSEVDPNTYEQVLTCFLFPQVPLSPIVTKVKNDKPEIADAHNTSRHISFVDMKAPPKVPEKPGQLRRAPTPYPKELRALAKHAKNIQKDGTQDITQPMQNAVHIKAAKITPTLQQRFACDNKPEIENDNSDIMDGSKSNPMKTSIYDNLPGDTYDKPLDLNNYEEKTYKSVDHSLYSDSNDAGNEFEDKTNLERAPELNQPQSNEIYPNKGNIQKPQSLYGRNTEHVNFSPKVDNYRSNLNDAQNIFQRFSISSHEGRINNEPKHLTYEAAYNQVPLLDINNITYEPPPLRKDHMPVTDGNYHESVYEGETYIQAKEKLYGHRNLNTYGYSGSGRNMHSPRVPSVSQIVSSSSTMPNISNYNIYHGTNVESRQYQPSARHAPSPNSNTYNMEPSSPTYIATQSPELYSPIGHTDLTNPYRMTNTPLVSDDGSYGQIHAPPSQNMFPIYDGIPSPPNPPSEVSHSYSASVMSEPVYGTRQPPPYHIAAPYTKHAQFFNGTGG